MGSYEQELLTAELRAVTGFTVAEITDSDLSLIMDAALNEWLHYNPGLELTTASTAITTVQNQAAYALPSDALWIKEVCWAPDHVGDEELATLYADIQLGAFDPEHPSELTIIYQKYADFRRFFDGNWKVINNQIWLIPQPNVGGDKVAVFFAKAVSLEDLNTIKHQVFAELCRAYMKQRRAMDLIRTSGFRAGSYQVSAAVGEMMVKESDKAMTLARHRINNGYVAARTGAGQAVNSE